MIYLSAASEARTSSPPQIPPPRKRSDGFDSFGSDEKLQNFAGFSGASSSNNLLVPAFLPFNELIQKINTSIIEFLSPYSLLHDEMIKVKGHP